jgi:hypothetical protein
MKKKLSILAIILFSAQAIFAQGNKAVYGELGGNGLVFSGNYDMRFSKNENGLGFRVGFGFGGVSGVSIFTFPLGLNYLTGKGAHHLEVGFGVTPVTGTTNIFGDRATGSTIFYMPSFGYRYGKPGKGFVGRIYVGPVIVAGAAFFPWGGISAGIKF